ncbi:MAG: ATP-dependent helicase [Anaerolineales bacterium]|nr:ATP-dependent helicase [Anaerolineales bacterium]MDW8279324.1 ATP-dependent helicase [Anaerolineales bacterium]
MIFTLRPSQAEILRYRSGKMGIAAVPGAGKTFTLSALAAQIIASGVLQPDQEVLIVTLVNAAVDNFSARIGHLVEQRGLIPHLGYRVRTLHGLAHDIVREKPTLAGLEERFQILDERESEFLIAQAADAWLATHTELLIANYFKNELDDYQRNKAQRESLPDLVHSLAAAFIRSAKNRRLTPETLRQKLDTAPSLPLAEMGWAIFADYQRALAYRGAVDFDDLIALAYRVLESEPHYLARLQYRFPYILEDEAQDSSRIQEEILRLLAGHGNWVRVGDPNQAIFETFTTADPRLLKAFIAYEADFRRELPVSGRSQPFIIELANRLIDWVNTEHPAEPCRDALSLPYIQPTEPDDPQPNPPPNPEGIHIIAKKYTPEEEIEAVVQSLERWLPHHLDWTVAILVPQNKRGIEVVEALKRRGLPFIEMINSTLSTRNVAGALANVLGWLAAPASAAKLSLAYQVWRRAWRRETAPRHTRDESETSPETTAVQVEVYKRTSELLRKLERVEEYVFPPEHIECYETFPTLTDSELDVAALQELLAFRDVLRRWQGTALLPVDQTILTLAQELFSEPAELALAHKLALVLRQTADQHPDWRLPELTKELAIIARNERRFLGFAADDSGFDPERYRGQVVVTTMHKAKGLEWDRVYLMSVNNYDFPSLQPYDEYISEKWFVRDSLNLEAEALGQLNALEMGDEYHWYEEGVETQRARIDYVRERLRLLYVGITRARRELILTWNSGRRGDKFPALPLQALAGWLETRKTA